MPKMPRASKLSERMAALKAVEAEIQRSPGLAAKRHVVVPDLGAAVAASPSSSSEDERSAGEPNTKRPRLTLQKLGKVTNLTQRLHQAQVKLRNQPFKVYEAQQLHDAKERACGEALRDFNLCERQIKEALRRLSDARQKPRADAPATSPVVADSKTPCVEVFKVDDLVKIKPSYWKRLGVQACDRISERATCNFRVQHNSGTRCVLMAVKSFSIVADVPLDALEELTGDSLAPGTTVELLEASGGLRVGALGSVQRRAAEESYEVTFDGTVVTVPAAHLRRALVTAPTAPTAPVVRSWLGFRHLDYVRDAEGRRGVVQGPCDDPQNLLVHLPSLGFQTSVAASTLQTEEAYWAQKHAEYTAKLENIKEEIERCRADCQRSQAALEPLKEQEVKLKEKYQKAYDVVQKARKLATAATVRKVVSFATHQRPKELLHISSYVALRWRLLLNDEVLELDDAWRTLARQVMQASAVASLSMAERDQPFLFTNSSTRHGAQIFSVSHSTAQRILDAEVEAPEPIHSLALLKVAFGGGSDPEVLLDPDVQAYFTDPTVGVLVPKAVAPPQGLAQVLRPYQVQGYRWLLNNARHGLGCLLADDMGLGKTIQAIALILQLREEGLLKPMLIVAPTGLLHNWQREITKWAKGTLEVSTFHGKRRALPEPKRQKQGENGPQVLLTSYGVLRTDAELLSDEATAQRFGGVVLDEAQSIKNCASQVRRAVHQVASKVSVRVALSGTPVENSLSELFSIFDVLLPGYLSSSQQDFDRTFGNPLKLAARKNDDAHDDVVEKKKELLNRMKEPFLLRRLKSDPKIAADLPDKVEQHHECEMSAQQRKLYQQVLDEQFRVGIHGHQFESLSLLHAMREVCNHPWSLRETRRPRGCHRSDHDPKDVQSSGKCQKLHELLDVILANGEKVLVFCQSLSAIEVLSQQIQQRKDHPGVEQMTGNDDPKQRKAAEKRFQKNPAQKVLLLSQVGTVGLNLTAACNVIHFDRQYNPAKEDQATDRAHRIGQESKTVFVHYLITKETFEERLAEIIETKKRIASYVMFDCEKHITEMGNAELQEFFALKP